MFKYITLQEAIWIHEKTIEHSGGGVLGEINTGYLDSVLTHIQNDDYHPTFEDKLTHLFFCTCNFHCFQDGNKRLAITLSLKFLINNGYMAIASSFMQEFENISYHVASGAIKKELLLKIIREALNGTLSSNEDLKVEILNAIENNNKG